ncbi:integrase [Kaistella haifensis]|nr:integrase [Kaistella haifensis]
MKFSFKLREPKSAVPTPIYFTVFFKSEKKSLIYSTDKKIHPSDWDFDNNSAKSRQLKFHSNSYTQSLQRELNKISDLFIEIEALAEKHNEKLSSEILKTRLDERLERISTLSTDFFPVYDEFLELKKNDYTENGVSDSTYKRYSYFKTNLEEFQSYRKSKITFNDINLKFYNEFLKYCIDEKKHSANTLHRNIGLFKTFMHWSFKNKKTIKSDFLEFVKPKKQPTTEIALNIDQVTEIHKIDLSKKKRLEQVRDLFIIGCTTGQRFSNYSNFNKMDIVGDMILVPDCKNPEKLLSIPLMKVTKQILEKYDYNLPKISNQKFNEYIKEVFEDANFDMNTKLIRRYGKEIKEENIPFHKRVSSHTARRSFITIMLNNGVPTKIIMSITGHTSLPVFTAYYKPDDKARIESMEKAFEKLI